MCFVPERRALFRPLNLQKRREHVVFCVFWLKMCFAPQRRPLLPHLNFQKRSEAGAFCAFSVRNVLHATTDNGVHFFDIWTSKRGPNLVCFVDFDWENVLSPRRRVLFRHPNFQKWSEVEYFVHFDFKVCFAPQQHIFFSYFIWPAGSSPALLRAYFWKPLNHISLEIKLFCDFPTFSRICIFFLFTLCVLMFFLSSNLSLLRALSLLCCFSSVHVIGSLISKFPSIGSNYFNIYYILINFFL